MYTVYGRPDCTFCKLADALLTSLGLEFEYYDVSENPHARQFLKVEGHETVPQIYESSEGSRRHIGGYTELAAEMAKERKGT